MQYSAFARSAYSQNKPKPQFTSCSHYTSAPVFGGGSDAHDLSFWDPGRTILCWFMIFSWWRERVSTQVRNTMTLKSSYSQLSCSHFCPHSIGLSKSHVCKLCHYNRATFAWRKKEKPHYQIIAKPANVLDRGPLQVTWQWGGLSFPLEFS